MLSSYDANARGVHIIRVTFMCEDYVGHVAFRVGSNCKGAGLLSADFLECDIQEDIDRYTENDCSFRFNEEEEIYTATLKNGGGEELLVDGDESEFKQMVICIEFAEFVHET